MKFAPLPPPPTPQQLTNQARAQKALDDFFNPPPQPVLRPHTPIHPAPVSHIAVASKPPPVHRAERFSAEWLLTACLLGSTVGVLIAMFTHRKPVIKPTSGQSTPCVVGINEKEPWQ